MEYLTKRDIILASMFLGLETQIANNISINSKFKFYNSVISIIANKQTIIFKIAELGNFSTFLLIIEGEIIEAHTLNNGIFANKNIAASYSKKIISPIDFNRLINAAGGTNKSLNINQNPSFNSIYNNIKFNKQAFRSEFQRSSDYIVFDLGNDRTFRDWRFEYNPKTKSYYANLSNINSVWNLETIV